MIDIPRREVMPHNSTDFELSLGAVHLLSEKIVSLLKSDATSGLSCSHLQSLLVCIEHLMNMNEAILPNPADLKRSGYSIEQLLEAGLSLEGLKQSGYSIAALKKGFKQLLDSGASKASLERVGYTVPQLLAVDLSFQALKRAGYTVAELKKTGMVSEIDKVRVSLNTVESSADLKRAGYARLLAELSQNSYFSWKYRKEVVRETFCQISAKLHHDCTQDECNLLYRKFSADSFKRVFSIMRWMGLRIQVLQFMQDFMFSQSIDTVLEKIKETPSYQLYESSPNCFAVDKPASVLNLKMFEGEFPLNLSECDELMTRSSGAVKLTEAIHDTKNVTVETLTIITPLHQVLFQSSVSAISELLVFHNDCGRVHLRVDDPALLGAILQEELVCVVPVNYSVGQILTSTDLEYLKLLGYEHIWVENGAPVEKREGHKQLSYAQVSAWVQGEVQKWRVSHKKMGVPDADFRIIECVISDLYAGWQQSPQVHQDSLKKLELWCVYLRMLKGDDVVKLNSIPDVSVNNFIFGSLKEYLCVKSDELPFSAAVGMVRLNYHMFSELCYSIFEVSGASDVIDVRFLYSDADCKALYPGIDGTDEGNEASEQMRTEVLTALALANQQMPTSTWKMQKMALGKSFLDALYWADLGKFDVSNERDLSINDLKSLKDLAVLPKGFKTSQAFCEHKIESINRIRSTPISVLPEEARTAILSYMLPGNLTPYGVDQFYQKNMAQSSESYALRKWNIGAQMHRVILDGKGRAVSGFKLTASALKLLPNNVTLKMKGNTGLANALMGYLPARFARERTIVVDASQDSAEAVAEILAVNDVIDGAKADVITQHQSIVLAKQHPLKQSDIQVSAHSEKLDVNVHAPRVPIVSYVHDDSTKVDVPQSVFRQFMDKCQRHRILIISMLCIGCLVGVGTYHLLMIPILNTLLFNTVPTVFVFLANPVVAAVLAGIFTAVLVVPLAAMLIQSVWHFFHSASAQDSEVLNVIYSDSQLLQEVQEKAHLPFPRFPNYLKQLWSVQLSSAAWDSSMGESITDFLVLGICVFLMAWSFPHTLAVILFGVLPCLVYAGYLYVQLCKQTLQSQYGTVPQYLHEQKWTLDENRWCRKPDEVLEQIQVCRDKVAAFSEAPVTAVTLEHTGNRRVKLPPLKGMGDHFLRPFKQDSTLQAARPEVR
jgi:hypothetical protein